jgi:hypothetical protein
MMRANLAWKGDWVERVNLRLKERGFDSLESFTSSHPECTFVELADELGDDVVPVQIEMLLRKEAAEGGWGERFARDYLARELRARLPQGWGLTPKSDYRRAGAFAAWKTFLGEENASSADRAWENLKCLSPSGGWVPVGADDALLLRAFDSIGFSFGSPPPPS